MIGVDASLTPNHFPAEATPSIPVAHFGGSLLRHLPSGETPPETSCLETDSLGGDVTEAMQPDGDAPHHNGRPLYCPDDTDTGAVHVCVENGDSTSECQVCGGETAYPGCPCANQSECGPDLYCWGVPDIDGGGGDPIGRCYPTTSAPQWICPYACGSQYPNGGWCFSQHESGQARCVDGLIDHIQINACWTAPGGPLVPNIDYPADSDVPCIVECNDIGQTAECAALGFPASIGYVCAPNHICTRAEGLP